MTRRTAMEDTLAGILGSQVVVLPARSSGNSDPEPPPMVVLGPRVAQAFAFARQVHASQARKGTAIPYLTHPMAVAALVGESGGTEDEVVAALLHDTVEDGGGTPILQEIRRTFGPEVADLVAGCTDDESGDLKAPWLQRKRDYLTHMVGASLGVLRIACADKLHNARSIERDHRDAGTAVFKRFKGDREGTLWYYRGLARLYSALLIDEPSLDSGFRALIRDLRETVARLEG